MPGHRKALAQRGGALRTTGDPSIVETLVAAWRATERDDERWTHGFHAYPARMHPGLARVLIRGYGRPERRLLDPFCGSGTSLVEGMVAGMRTVGIDLNPVALRVAAVKTDRRSNEERQRFVDRLAAVVERSLERVKARVPVLAPVRGSERRFYDPHVLKELGGLHAEISQVQPAADRQILLTLLSAIVVKFSRQRADTSVESMTKRIGKGVPTRFFARKGDELVRRWAALDAACPSRCFRPSLVEADARFMHDSVSLDERVDLIVTSPPYGGTYDYAEHHVRRYPWLGVSPRRLRDHEIGARRATTKKHAARRWDQDVSAVLRSMVRLMNDHAIAFWVMGDGQIGRRRVPADEQLTRLAPEAGLEIVAIASQRRRDWQGRADRWEHIIALTPQSPSTITEPNPEEGRQA